MGSSSLPDQRSNLSSLHWECRVLATGPPEKFLVLFILYYVRVLCIQKLKTVKKIPGIFAITASFKWILVIKEKKVKAVKIKLPHNYKAHYCTVSWSLFPQLLPQVYAGPTRAQRATQTPSGHTCGGLSLREADRLFGRGRQLLPCGLEMTGPRPQWRPLHQGLWGQRGEESSNRDTTQFCPSSGGTRHN